ncbi:MAG: hypothetical protein ACOVQH_04030 [Burkholderiaceae bacterium]
MNRGGSWNNEAANCRSANRNRNNPSNRNNNNGFRVALNSNGRKSWMASGGCPGIPDGTVRFPVWPGFGLVSKTSTRDRVVLVGRLDDVLRVFGMCRSGVALGEPPSSCWGWFAPKP